MEICDMAGDSNRSASETEPVTAGAARYIVRGANTAALATLEASSGAPYASLVSVATLPSATPVITMSSLSHHSANIQSDNRVSLLFDGTPKKGNPLEGGRVSVSGRAQKVTDKNVARRFMARHAHAYYTKFGDFDFYIIDIDRVHYIAGFGRVRWFRQAGFLVDCDLADVEPELLAQLNQDHADIVAACAARLLNAPAVAWRICGIDIEGADLNCDGVALRLDFPTLATSADTARQMLFDLARSPEAADDAR
ncbi:MAG: HugZ family protein [Hyphomicrobiales bacterium]